MTGVELFGWQLLGLLAVATLLLAGAGWWWRKRWLVMASALPGAVLCEVAVLSVVPSFDWPAVLACAVVLMSVVALSVPLRRLSDDS